jgi:hypothetical protein
MAEDVESIISEVLVDLGLDTTTPVLISRANVLQQVNNCLIDLTENTYAFQANDTSSITWVTSQRSYTLPTDLFDIISIYDPVKDRELWPITTGTLDGMSKDWKEDEGEVYYYWRGGTETMSHLSFYKLPSSDYNTYSPEMQYRQYQTALTDSSSSYLPNPIHTSRIMVVDYCKGRLQRIHKEIRDTEEADKFWGNYLVKRRHWEAVDEASGRIYVMGSRPRIAPSPVGPRWPDQYPNVR